jgi:hypothetical protein
MPPRRRADRSHPIYVREDLDDGYLRIAQEIVQVGGQVYAGPPKTKAGVRPVALDQATVEALRAHRTAQRRERLAWGEAWQDTGLVFTQEDGSMLRPHSVTIRFRVLAKEEGCRRSGFTTSGTRVRASLWRRTSR